MLHALESFFWGSTHQIITLSLNSPGIPKGHGYGKHAIFVHNIWYHSVNVWYYHYSRSNKIQCEYQPQKPLAWRPSVSLSSPGRTLWGQCTCCRLVSPVDSMEWHVITPCRDPGPYKAPYPLYWRFALNILILWFWRRPQVHVHSAYIFATHFRVVKSLRPREVRGRCYCWE